MIYVATKKEYHQRLTKIAPKEQTCYQMLKFVKNDKR